LVLRRAGRVPVSDSFLSQRTEGPGLSQNWFYQVTTDVALLALQAHLEKEELNYYNTMTQKKINESIEKFGQIQSEIFSQFGLRFDSSHPVYTSIQERNRQISEKLRIRFEKKSYSISKFPHNVKQTSADLVETLEQGTILVQEFYPNHIFNLMSEDQITKFWFDLNLAPDDWTGLTKFLFNQRVFSGQFLQPLEDDKGFSLKVSHVSFMDMIVTAKPRDDLDLKFAEFALVNSSIYSSKPLLNLLERNVPFGNIPTNVSNFDNWFFKTDDTSVGK